MKTFVECVPCFVRQTIDTMRELDAEEADIEQALREVLRMAADFDFSIPPAAMGRDIHRTIRRITGCDDPFREVKRRQNEFALEIYPRVERMVEQADDPFEAAARAAIAGKIIDHGTGFTPDEEAVLATMDKALHDPLEGDAGALKAAAGRAADILYLADNAGEIVFDRLLVERLPSECLTLAVRGGPAINDALIEDARQAGLTDIVHVIQNGSDAPGTILDDCSGEFRDAFDSADLIISKGQGNYETVSPVAGKEIFYLLKAKCPVICRHLGCARGMMVVQSASARRD